MPNHNIIKCEVCGIEFGATKAYEEHKKTHEAQGETSQMHAQVSPIEPAKTDLIHPVEVDPNDPIAAKVKEYDEAIKKANELNAKLEAQYKENTAKFESGFKGMSIQEQQSIIEAHKTDADKMKEHLASQDKVQIFVPLDGKELLGTQLPVTVNGYRVNVPKGVYCKVPQQIADIVMDSLNQTQAALSNPFLIDNDEKKQTALG